MGVHATLIFISFCISETSCQFRDSCLWEAFFTSHVRQASRPREYRHHWASTILQGNCKFPPPTPYPQPRLPPPQMPPSFSLRQHERQLSRVRCCHTNRVILSRRAHVTIIAKQRGGVPLQWRTMLSGPEKIKLAAKALIQMQCETLNGNSGRWQWALSQHEDWSVPSLLRASFCEPEKSRSCVTEAEYRWTYVCVMGLGNAGLCSPFIYFPMMHLVLNIGMFHHA